MRHVENLLKDILAALTESQLRTKQFAWRGLKCHLRNFDLHALCVCYDFSLVNVKSSDPTHAGEAWRDVGSHQADEFVAA